jgi:alkylation response protein AidB-like acyl-CoA dehydrogenase
MELTTEQQDLRDAVRGLLARHRRPGAAEPGPAAEPSPARDPRSAREPHRAAEPSPAGEPGPAREPHPAAEPSPAGEPGTGRAPGPGYDPALWRRLCGEIGVAGLAIPERYGGAGAGPVETCLVLEELGRGLVPSPLLGSAVLAAQALLAAGDDEACRRLLPGIADGATVAALAWAPQAGHWDPAGPAFTACPDPGAGPAAADGWVLTGESHHVLDGDTAGVLLAAAHTPGGTALFEVDPRHRGVTRRVLTAMDTTRRLAAVALDGAPGRLLGAGAGGGDRALARARDLACIALSAEQTGAAQRALELTVAYAKTRVQFGRPIGSFQALQHRMADLHVLVESARSLCYAAAFAAAGTGADPARLGMLAAAAKAHCSHALARAAGQMIQLHGAIGITWEHDAHRYFKRAHGAGQLFGRPDEHVARIAAALIDG